LPPIAHLHMVIHGFVLEEFTKPAHEHHLQVFTFPSGKPKSSYLSGLEIASKPNSKEEYLSLDKKN